MFSKLFGKRARFDSSDPDLRGAAIEGLSSAEVGRSQRELTAMALEDPVPALRCAAIRRLSSVDDLTDLLSDGDAQVCQEASQRLADLAVADPGLLDSPAVRLARIRNATTVAAIEQLLPPLVETSAPSAIVDLAVESRNPDVRLTVAGHVNGEANLGELERRTRSRDKRVNRLARSQLDSIRRARSAHAESRRRAEHALSSIAEFAADDSAVGARASAKNHLDALLQAWQTHWATVQSSREELMRLGESADSDESLHERLVDAHAKANARLEALPAEAPVMPPAPDLNEVMGRLQRLHADLTTGNSDPLSESDALEGQYKDIVERWSRGLNSTEPAGEVTVEFRALSRELVALFASVRRLERTLPELRRLLDQLPEDKTLGDGAAKTIWQRRDRGARASEKLGAITAQIGWASAFPTPEVLLDAAHRQRAFADFAARCDDRIRDLETRGRTLITTLEEHIAAGNLDAALSTDHDVRATLRDLPERESRDLRQQAHPLEARLQELKDWRSYATSPKRDELLEQMQALIGSDLAAPRLADEIKALREAWIQLGPMTDRHDRNASARFNQAAEQAFAPCREFYAEQARIRESNLAHRRSICDYLQQYLEDTDWTRIDCKVAERILRTARDEWRNHHPVDRAPGRELSTRFDQLTDELHGHIKAEWDRNIARKEALIEEANQAVNTDESNLDATDIIKELQRRWRDVGATPRKVDQRLWKTFRAICDTAFTRRDEHHADQQQQLERQAAAAKSLCDEFQNHMDDCPISGVREAVLRDFQRRFDDLGELPAAHRGALRKRFEELQRTYRGLLQDSVQFELMEDLQRWSAADETLAALERQIAAGGTAEFPGPDGLEVDPTPLEPRIQHISAGTFVDDPDGEAQRRQFTLDAEIRAGLESPENDRQLRLERQVERLNRGLTTGRTEPDPLDLARSWCALGSIAEPHDTELRERFFAALKIIAD